MLLNGRSSKFPGETVFFTKVAPDEGRSSKFPGETVFFTSLKTIKK